MCPVLPLDAPLVPVELDPVRFARTWKAVRDALSESVAPGIVAGLWEAREPNRVALAALGQTRSSGGDPIRPETIFDLASLTKIVATAPLAATLVERGWISWDTPVVEIFPAFRFPDIRLRHLLSHTAGFPAWMPLWERVRDRFAPEKLHEVSVSRRQSAMRELVLAVEPETAPGVRAVYSDICFLLLGFALEEATGLPLDQAVRRFVWEPMRLKSFEYRHTTRAPERAIDRRVAATELSPWHGTVLQGQVHDENCWAMGGYSGHAGAFGDATDVLRFARALMTSDFLTPATRAAMWSRVPEPAGCERTLGWDTPSLKDSSTGRFFSARSIGHLGFTGTSLWLDPEAGIAVTLLSNRVHPTRENALIRAFRPKFHDAIRLDLDPSRGSQ